MHVIDRVAQERGCLRIQGWCFKAGTKITGATAEAGKTLVPVGGWGLGSDDVAQHYGADARYARFDISVQTSGPSCVLEFAFDDGSVSRIQAVLPGSPLKVVALEHRIHQGAYSGRFRLHVPDPIESVHFLPGTDAAQGRSEPLAFSESETGDERILSLRTDVPLEWDTRDLGVLIQTYAETLSLTSIPSTARSQDRSHQICARFFESLRQSPVPLKVVEIGSRARSGVVRKHQFGEGNHYIGVDIREGPNVDLVGDIHTLSHCMEPNSVDAIAGFSVFEHVAMPWKAALELNKVLKRGGKCLLHTHQAWPVHESPYDFWRFSTDSWRALFNRATGFRILDSACGGDATLHPLIQNRRADPVERALAYTSSSVLAEKTCETQLSWDVDLEEIHRGHYPA